MNQVQMDDLTNEISILVEDRLREKGLFTVRDAGFGLLEFDHSGRTVQIEIAVGEV